MTRPRLPSCSWLLVLACLFLLAGSASAQLFENLEAFGRRLDVGDPATISTWEVGDEGPKGLDTGDLDGDGTADLAASNLDGTVTIYRNRGDGKFTAPLHLRGPVETLRGIVIADLNADGKPDIAAAAPLDAVVLVFPGLGGGSFGAPLSVSTWNFARNVAAGDFDGDGNLELVAAGPGLGLRQYRWTAAGAFEQVAEIADLLLAGYGSTRPVFPMRVVRQAGAAKDELLVTHAWSNSLWILGAGADGKLRIQGEVSGLISPTIGDGVHSFDVGPITGPAVSGSPDLVTTHRDTGVIQVRKSIPGPNRFASQVHQEILIQGGPRSVRIVDLDGDGWNDLAVSLRYLHRVLTYKNQNGTLVPASEMPVGNSPRDLVTADFNLDSHPDIAVINRLSSDISVLPGSPGKVGFSVLDQFYLVDGEVAGLQVLDWNRDGRDDVIQLHRASGDVSVRLAGPDGTLAPPAYFPMGELPGAMNVVDVNNDGSIDAVTANLGVELGSVSVRLGQPDGSLGPEGRYDLPAEVQGRLFALEVADFDGDGNIDLAAGFADCRLGLFRGSGDGSFELTSVSPFTYESRVMAARDYDGDGDSDLAGAGYAGDVVVLENRGDFLTAPQAHRQDYPTPSEGKFGVEDLKVADLNGDGDLDLVLGSGQGAMVYFGADGVDFFLAYETVPGTQFPASSLGIGDFDGDGAKDIAVSCQILACVVLLTRDPDNGGFVPALAVDVPAGKLLASGDLDGDGHADLVGSGEVLWTALSSRRAQASGPPVLEVDRPIAPGPVINEVLAINNAWPLASDGGRTVDWIEVFNGAEQVRSLSGWKLRVVKRDPAPGEAPLEYTFPPDAVAPSRGHLLLVCSNGIRSTYHTGFKIPGSGGTVYLFDGSGAEVDFVRYPPQRENLSYGRYADGVRSLVFNNYPSPGVKNLDNGGVPPILKLDAAWSVFSEPNAPRGPQPGEPIRFEATGKDDVVIVATSVLYQRLDIPDSGIHRVVLYDDGMHDDGGMQDGSFVGFHESGLPSGAEIRFQVEVRDLSGNVTLLPDGAEESEAGLAGFYSLAVGSSLPRLEFSEVVARNDTGLKDENGGTPDWVEVRNCSAEPVSLAGVFLGRRYPANEDWFPFPRERTLQPGEHLVVFCDGSENQGPLHAPFNLNLSSDRLVLIGTAPNGAHGVIDVLEYGEQQPDVAFARIGCGGRWVNTVPTPGQDNRTGNEVRVGDVNASGGINITDPIVILNHLFLGGAMACPDAADPNGDTAVDLSDAVHLLVYLFSGGPAPVEKPTGCLRA